MGTALYMRVSTEMQEEHGISLETQDDTLMSYCKFKNFKNIKKYIDVGSARNTKRANFQQMMKDIENGVIKQVVILKLDRLTRSIVDLNKLLQKFKKYNCELHSATENIDTTTATGRMIINLIATFAQWESETISERVVINMMTNARKGIWQGPAPFGFSKNEEGKLIVNENEANILREAFDMILEGNSFSSTEKYIARKYNLKWKDNYLRRKVRTQTIIGNIERNNEIIENTHEGIITKKEQQHLIERLEENRSARTSIENKLNDIFRRKINCYQCNNKLALSTSYQSKKEVHYYYKCNNCFKRGNGTISIGENKMLKAIKAYFDEIELDNIQTIKNEKKEKTAITKMKNRLDEINEERDRIQRAWIKKLMSDEDLQRYQTELDDEQSEIEIKLSKLEEPFMTKKEYEKVVQKLREGFDNLSREDKKEFVQRFIKHIDFSRTLVEGYQKKYDIKVTNVEFY